MKDLREMQVSKDELIRQALKCFKAKETALLNIDYTNDFVADNGALTCGKPAQDIQDEIVNITKFATENGYYVVYPIDGHTKNDEFHPESKMFPQHNIIGTQGRELYGKLNDLYLATSKKNNVHYLNKTRYSAFAGTDLEQKLRERNIKTVILVGVCTDICVLHTAMDAYNRGFKIVIASNAVTSFNKVGHEFAIEHMKNCLGAEII